MSHSIAIGQVSSALQKMLFEGIKQINQSANGSSVPVTVLGLADESDAPRVNLYLYKVIENTTLKNLDWQADHNYPEQIVQPPLSLNLFYMLTPYGLNDAESGNTSSHELLGMAMSVFHKNPYLPTEHNRDFEFSREKVKIILCPFDMEECNKVWSASTKPFRLSAVYEVSSVQIDTGNVMPVSKRVRHVGTPETEAPFFPPAISQMIPDRGQAGCNVKVYGKNFSKWSKVVTISGIEKAAVTDINSETFEFTIPSHYPCGLYQISIAVDQLCFQTFFFEITT
jgi:hypothetical protein